VNGIIGVAQRWASARAGEGIIFDLRTALYGHLQRMSLAFFTISK
jgi:ATP-binding cassette subfamily B protein